MRMPYAVSIFQAKELGFLGKLGEVKYWYVSRKTRKFIPWVARKLPDGVKYWVVIDSMVRVEPNENPTTVSAMEILDLLGNQDSRMTDRQSLGSQVFANLEETVIGYKGANYYKACDAFVADLPEGGAEYCVKRVGHSGNTHEAYSGNTIEEEQ